MPVRKLRSVAEAPAVAASPLEGRNLRAAAEVSAVCFALRPWSVPKGVRRHASIAAAQAWRRAAEAAEHR